MAIVAPLIGSAKISRSKAKVTSLDTSKTLSRALSTNNLNDLLSFSCCVYNGIGSCVVRLPFATQSQKVPASVFVILLFSFCIRSLRDSLNSTGYSGGVSSCLCFEGSLERFSEARIRISFSLGSV